MVNLNIEERRRDFLRLVELEEHYNDHGHQPSLWREYAEIANLSKEERLWLCVLAVGYSHEGATWVAYNQAGVKERDRLPPDYLKIAILRRNLYGGRLRDHFEDWARITNLTEWVDQFSTWHDLLQGLMTIYGNGTWAAYTTAETMIDVAGLPIVPDVEGFAANTGPRATLIHLGFEPTEAGAAELVQMVKDADIQIPVVTLETVMCYWQNMNKGKFYPGRSIDRQQNQIEYALDFGVDCDVLWECRKQAFREETLGEIQGWPGLDKPRLKHYMLTGEILLPTERRG